MSRADAAARSLVDQATPVDLPVDPERIAQGLGVIVAKQGNDAGVSGILMRRDGQVVLGINAAESPEAQRFALAHLIGHLQIHARRPLLLDTIERHRYSKLPSMPTDREEAEANRFAAALLAPEALVRKAAREATFTTAAELAGILAERFQLSRAVMGYRLMTLGVVMDF